MTALFVASVASCARARVPEPPYERQLSSEQDCFAHMLQEWQHLKLGRLAGTVVAHHDAPAYIGIPEATVFARQWPRGHLLRATTDHAGRFELPGAAHGRFEVAVCLPGFNPWRGIVEVSSGAQERDGIFPLTLGM